MCRGNAVGVVVLVYNKTWLVGGVIGAFFASVDHTHVVDDRSTDGTWEVIRRYAARVDEREAAPVVAVIDGGVPLDRRVVPIRHAVSREYGAAVKTGYEHVLAGDMDVIVVMDGDGQMDPDIMPVVIDPVVDRDADYAVGGRFVTRDSRRGVSLWRLFDNLLLSGLTRITSGYRYIRDPQNGYTAVSASAPSELEFDRLYDQCGFLSDLPMDLSVARKRITTVPTCVRCGDEESSIRYSTFVPGLSCLLLRGSLWRPWVRYLDSGAYPVTVLYTLGVVGVLADVLRLVSGAAPKDCDSAGRATLVGVIGGVASLGTAMLLDSCANEPLRIVAAPSASFERDEPSNSQSSRVGDDDKND